ncbi:MAG: MnhB domain-containing protein [Brachymonas sp.]|nr:MnhB domain-containing protein [Brachymonas sp.]
MKLNSRVVVLETMSRPLYVLILLLSAAVYWRGHNEPGGGFIAALLASSATVLWACTHGREAALKRMPLQSPVKLGVLGVLLAAGSGIPGLLAGHSYMHHLWWNFPWIDLTTVQMFDLGVYFGVWGGIGGYAVELMALGDEDLAEEEARQ